MQLSIDRDLTPEEVRSSDKKRSNRDQEVCVTSEGLGPGRILEPFNQLDDFGVKEVDVLPLVSIMDGNLNMSMVYTSTVILRIIPWMFITKYFQ